jgi:catechol 2,3-dioxygenase-like lactoylglutathione lyase family enzyme
MFSSISVLSIPVKDQQVAKSFYTEILGCKVVADIPFGSHRVTRWLQLQLPGVETTLALVTWFPHMPPGSVQGIVLATADITRAHTALKERGLAISDIHHEPYGQEATFSDLDGNGWVLQQPASVA